MEVFRFQIVIEQDEDGWYVADVPALQGCHAQGKTFEEAISNVREVIATCVEERRERGEPVPSNYPEVIGIKSIEVAV